MRRPSFLCMLVVGLLATRIERPLSQSTYLAENEKKARQLLQKAIQALGGETYLKIEDLTKVGRFYQFRQDDLRGGEICQIYEKFPLKSRREIGKKGEIAIVNNGEQGWHIDYKNVKPQSPEEIKAYLVDMSHNLDHILHSRLQEQGMRLRYLGTSRLDLDELEGVELIDKDNDRVRVFVSATSFLPVKMEFKAPAFGKKWESDDERFFYNYHTFQGVQFPLFITRNSNGYKISEFRFDSVKVNSGLSDSLFGPAVTSRK